MHENGAFADPPGHRACVTYALQVCPYLAAPSYAKRIDGETLIDRAGIRPRDLLREKGTPYAELGLSDMSLSDDALVDAMMAHPILINRPLVVSPRQVMFGGRYAEAAALFG